MLEELEFLSQGGLIGFVSWLNTFRRFANHEPDRNTNILYSNAAG